MSAQPIPVRIFISSPSDVLEEREQARRIVAQLQRHYLGSLELIPVLWEELPLDMQSSFQEGIDVFLNHPTRIDVGVFILWSRLGSPVGPRIKRADGSEYNSGTEREFDLLMKASKNSTDGRPIPLAYVRQDADSFEARLRHQSTDQMTAIIEQKHRVERFIEEQFQDAETGTNTRAFHTYEHPLEFAHRFRLHLQAILDDFVGQNPGKVRWEGAPFRGLEAFDVEHSPIFFGREQEIADLLLALESRARDGCGSLIIAGASGTGKSSLVRAGVIPSLIHDNVDGSTGRWRYAIMNPRSSAPDFLTGLVDALRSETALPQINDQAIDPKDLAEALARDPKGAISLSLKNTLVSLDDRTGPAKLLLFIDQFEELFTHAHRGEEGIEPFLAALVELAKDDRFRVIGTIRSDFYAEMQRFDDLLTLRHGEGLYDLKPLGPAALHRVITRPAMLAGLRFERDPVTEQSLDVRLLDDAADHPEALPLVQFALWKLFDERNESGVLPIAAYERAGGVIGSLSTHAENVFSALSSVAQDSLGHVFHELLTVSSEDDRSVLRKQADLNRLRQNPAHAEFVNKFIEQRLLITDRSSAGMPVVSVAHEALFRRWSRLTEWISSNKEFLAGRARVQHDLDRWIFEDRSDDFLIADGKPMEDARALLLLGRERLSSDQVTYIEASIAFYDALRKRSIRRTQAVTAVLLVLCLISAVVGALALVQMRRAEAQTERSVRLNEVLREQLYENRISVAEREIEQNHDLDLASLLLAECPEELRGWEWNYLQRRLQLPNTILEGHEGGLWGIDVNPSGTIAVTAGLDGTARVWDLTTNEQSLVFDRHNQFILQTRALAETLKATRLGLANDLASPLSQQLEGKDVVVKSVAFSNDGSRVATGSLEPNPLNLRDSTGMVYVWDPLTGEVLQSFDDQVGLTITHAFDADDRRIASSSINDDHSFVVWDSTTGELIHRVTGHTGHVAALEFSHDGKWLVSGGIDGAIMLWDANTLELVTQIDAHSAPIMDIVYSPDESYIASAAQDGLIRLWTLPDLTRTHTLKGHTGSALCLSFHPDGDRLASGGFDQTVRLWDPKTGRLKITLRGHTDTVWGITFSDEGDRLYTAAFDNTARVWDATTSESQEDVARLRLHGHDDRVNAVAYSPDGSLIATGSWDYDVRLWDAETGELIRILEGHKGAIWGLDFSPDGRQLASASWDQRAIIWDIESGEVQREFTGHDAPIHCVQFVPNSDLFVTSGWDGFAQVWNLRTGELHTTLDVALWVPVLGLAVNTEGTLLATAAGDQKIKVYELHEDPDQQSTRPSFDDKYHNAALNQFAFSPTDTRVAVASWDHTATVWDFTLRGQEDPTPVVTLAGHTDRVYGIAYSPDGTRIATSSHDKTIRIWDAYSGNQLCEPIYHQGTVWDVVFHPDGREVAGATWTSSSWVQITSLKGDQLPGTQERTDNLESTRAPELR